MELSLLCPEHCISVGLKNQAQTKKCFELLIKVQVLSIKEDSTAHCLIEWHTPESQRMLSKRLSTFTQGK